MRWYLSRSCSYNSQRDLKKRRISARWIPHLVTKEQRLARVRIAKHFLKQFPKYNNRSFANIITGDETWVLFYEPKRNNTEQNFGNQRRQKTLHSKTHHEHQKGNVCNFLYKSRSCCSAGVVGWCDGAG